MKSAIRRIQSASHKLRKSYSRGLIPYPRTDWSYIQEKPFDFHAHPPIPHFDEYSLPLSFPDYPFIKETMPLELTNARIVSASTIINVMTMVDVFYDDDMQPNPFKKKELQTVMEGFYKHIEELHSMYGEDVIGGSDGKPIKYENIMPDKNTSKMSMKIIPYRIELAPSPKRAEKVKERSKKYKKRVRDDIENFTSLKDEAIPVKSLEEALVSFRKKRMGMEFLRKQRELIRRQQASDFKRNSI